MNWQFGVSLGNNAFNGHIYGLASLASDLLKAIIPILIIAHMRAGAYVRVAASILLGVICISYSLTSSLGFAAMNRAAVTGDREISVSEHLSDRKKIARLEARLDSLPLTRPVAAIHADLDRSNNTQVKVKGRRTNVKEATGNCTRANWITRKYCKKMYVFRKQLAIAKDRLSAETQLDEIKIKLKNSTGIVATGKVDPQAEFLSSLFNINVEHTQLFLMLLVAMLLEIGSAFGPFILYASNANVQKRAYNSGREIEEFTYIKNKYQYAQLCDNSRAKLVTKLNDNKLDISSIDQWLVDRAKIVRAPHLRASELYNEHYAKHCENPVSFQLFCRHMNKVIGKRNIKRKHDGYYYPVLVVADVDCGHAMAA